jgi:hypothetical protein
MKLIDTRANSAMWGVPRLTHVTPIVVGHGSTFSYNKSSKERFCAPMFHDFTTQVELRGFHEPN